MQKPKGMSRSKGPKGGPPLDPPPDLRAKMKRRREQLGWSQRAAGRRGGASQGTVSNLETGRHAVERAFFLRYFRALYGEDSVSADTEDDTAFLCDYATCSADGRKLIRDFVAMVISRHKS